MTSREKFVFGDLSILVGDHSNYFCIPYVKGLRYKLYGQAPADQNKVILFCSPQSVEHCPLQSFVRACKQLHFFALSFFLLSFSLLCLSVCICLFDLSAFLFCSPRFFGTEYSWKR